MDGQSPSELLLFKLHSKTNQYEELSKIRHGAKEIDGCTDGQLAHLTSSQKSGH